MKKVFSFVALCILFFGSCSRPDLYIKTSEESFHSDSPLQEDDLIFETYLIGDAGAPSIQNQEPVLKLFESFLENAGPRSAAVF